MTTLAINEHFILTLVYDQKQAAIVKEVLERMNVEIDSSEAIGVKVKYHLYVHGILHATEVVKKIDSKLILKNTLFVD